MFVLPLEALKRQVRAKDFALNSTVRYQRKIIFWAKTCLRMRTRCSTHFFNSGNIWLRKPLVYITYLDHFLQFLRQTIQCWRESKCGLLFERAGNVCYCAFRVCSDVAVIVTTWMPVPLNQNGNKLFLIQRLLIVLGTGLSVIRFFFSSLPSLVAVSSFPSSASEKKTLFFFFKWHSIPCIWAVSRWTVVGWKLMWGCVWLILVQPEGMSWCL